MLHKIRMAISAADGINPLSGNVQAGLILYGRQVKQYDSASSRPQSAQSVSKLPVIIGASYDRIDNLVHLKMKIVPANHMNGHHLLRSGKQHFISRWGHSGMLEQNICAKRFIFYRNRALIDIVRTATAWINRTFHGIGRRYLQLYFDEFCFRHHFKHRPQEAFNQLASFCICFSSNRDLSLKAA
ncbi:transposase [Paenibacillus beijingensis]|uniref:transposase n=1 Tax=Paenibacillus beijingensis TaxID=1126833 RepID=UPI000B1C46E3|nr:transposase [Paenibacillus beijingensis]